MLVGNFAPLFILESRSRQKTSLGKLFFRQSARTDSAVTKPAVSKNIHAKNSKCGNQYWMSLFLCSRNALLINLDVISNMCRLISSIYEYNFHQRKHGMILTLQFSCQCVLAAFQQLRFWFRSTSSVENDTLTLPFPCLTSPSCVPNQNYQSLELAFLF